jgi:hypothetical protein
MALNVCNPDPFRFESPLEICKLPAILGAQGRLNNLYPASKAALNALTGFPPKLPN